MCRRYLAVKAGEAGPLVNAVEEPRELQVGQRTLVAERAGELRSAVTEAARNGVRNVTTTERPVNRDSRLASAPVSDARANEVVPLAQGPLDKAVPRVLRWLDPALGADADVVAIIVDQSKKFAHQEQ